MEKSEREDVGRVAASQLRFGLFHSFSCIVLRLADGVGFLDFGVYALLILLRKKERR